MANSPTPSSPSMPDRGSQTEAHVPDHKLPENSRENLDSKLDLAIEETFPTSDPVSPFVPAIRTEADPAPDGSFRCAHAGCTCAVTPPEQWCSEQCRDMQQGFLAPNATCACGHSGCACHG